jgi:dTDP-4-amino-4,6-dideoxygalactose transaminase
MQKCLLNGDLILRNEVAEFEAKLAEFLGVKYAVGVNSGTDALIISLKTAGIGIGDEVITSGHTFWATAEAILHVGAMPVLLEIDDNLLMDVDKIEENITEFTKAIIPVHLAGAVCDMDKIMALAHKYNLKVIEDAAQAIGAKFGDKKAGTFGWSGCFSFYPAKILGSYGDAGALVTNDPLVATQALALRNHGERGKLGLGYNSRLDNIQAAVLNVKLKYLSHSIIKRYEHAKQYDVGLAQLAHQEKIKLPKIRYVYQDYIIKAPAYWLALHQFLKDEGVETIIDHYDFPPEYVRHPSVEHLQAIRLPLAPELTKEQIDFVIKKIKLFYEDSSEG